ncbi:hypothetical protein ZOSMA_200G00330 [Zostera marina]|uniref:Uncharacterized protein n=1 Tax=Zostera marina TaxID=29655 RepID=A0A0K9PLT6_ZOSMR|nr:hypothetical protein ZOSMA_200G00330 [Zostera marina]
MENIEQVEIFEKAVSQFYANLIYSKHDSSLSTLVNNFDMDISKEILPRWGPLPREGICIHMIKGLESLPFTCTSQQLWTSLTNASDSRKEGKIHYKDLTETALILLTIIDNCLCPVTIMIDKPTMMAQVAAFCILNRIKVDWTSLVMHNMAMVSKVPKKERHYPRHISKFLNKENLHLYVSEDSKIHPLKYFTTSSFKQKLLKRSYKADKKEMNAIREEISEMKLILDAHMDMALLNTDTMMGLKNIHTKSDNFDDEVLRQIVLVDKNYKNLKEQIKLNEVKIELAKAKVKNICVNQELLLKKLGFTTKND